MDIYEFAINRPAAKAVFENDALEAVKNAEADSLDSRDSVALLHMKLNALIWTAESDAEFGGDPRPGLIRDIAVMRRAIEIAEQ